MKRKIAAVVLAAFAVVGLAGCTLDTGTLEEPFSPYAYGWVDTGDGRTVWCLQIERGPSCDWANAKTVKIVEVTPDANE